MGLLSNLPFFLSIRHADRNLRSKQARLRASYAQPDHDPFSSLVSGPVTTAVPAQPLDLELARGLLEEKIESGYLEFPGKEFSLIDAEWKDDVDHHDLDDLGNSEFDQFMTETTKSQGETNLPRDEIRLNPTDRPRNSRRARLRRKGYRGFEEFKKLLGHHRSQTKTSSKSLNPLQPLDVVSLDDDDRNRWSYKPESYTDAIASPGNSPREQHVQKSTRPSRQLETTNVVNKRIHSGSSDKTTVTVCRRPSRRVVSPITTIDSEFAYDAGQCDSRKTSYSRPSISDYGEPLLSGHPACRRSSAYSDDSSIRFVGSSENGPEEPTIYHRFPGKSSTSLETLSQRLFSSAGTHSTEQLRQQRAAREFNCLAKKLLLCPLIFEPDTVCIPGAYF
jgi:hypothetical protein